MESFVERIAWLERLERRVFCLSIEDKFRLIGTWMWMERNQSGCRRESKSGPGSAGKDGFVWLSVGTMAADRDGKLNRFFGWCLPAKWRVAVIDTWTGFEREFSLSFCSFIYSFYIRSIDGWKIPFKIDLSSSFFFFFFPLATKYTDRDWNFNRSNINSCWRTARVADTVGRDIAI